MDHPADGPSMVNRLTPFDPAGADAVLGPPVVLTARPGRGARPWYASTAAVVALVLLGAGLRTAALASDRCLWIDESMLALNLLARSPAQLLEPLDWNQGAPVGFLMVAKLSVMQ